MVTPTNGPENPYRPPATGDTGGAPTPIVRYGLVCPYCQTPMRITLKKYWSEPSIKKKCEFCQRKSQLRRTTPYQWAKFSTLTVLMLAGQLIGLHVAGIFGQLSGGFIAYFLHGSLFDRTFDQYLRVLDPLPEAEQ